MFEDRPDLLTAAIHYLKYPLAAGVLALPDEAPAVVDPLAHMAPRTAQILRWRNEGMIFKEIGQRLGVSKQRAIQIWQRARSGEPLYRTCTCGAVLTETATAGRPVKYCSTKCEPRVLQVSKYQLTRKHYNRLERFQCNLCAICRRPETARHATSGTVRSLSIDHDHETGAVRGLLCGKCNMGIGQAGDSTETLAAAAAYLRKHKGATSSVVQLAFSF